MSTLSHNRSWCDRKLARPKEPFRIVKHRSKPTCSTPRGHFDSPTASRNDTEPHFDSKLSNQDASRHGSQNSACLHGSTVNTIHNEGRQSSLSPLRCSKLDPADPRCWRPLRVETQFGPNTGASTHRTCKPQAHKLKHTHTHTHTAGSICTPG